MSPTPDPESTRKPDVPAHPIRLADGREWGFAQPSLRVYPVVLDAPDDDGRTVGMGSRIGYGMGIERRKRAVLDALSEDAEGGPSLPYAPIFALAIDLLREAHEIAPREVARLLEIEPEGFRDFAVGVLEIATGRKMPGLAAVADEGGAGE